MVRARSSAAPRLALQLASLAAACAFAKPFEVPELLLRVRMLLETRQPFNRVTRPEESQA